MISTYFDDAHDVLRIDILGAVNSAEIREYLKKIATEFRHKKELYVISDYTKGWIEADPGFFLINLNAVKDVFVQYFSPFDKYVNAYILGEDEKGTEVMIRQFIKLTEDIASFHPAFFDNYEAALSWIQERKHDSEN